MIKAERYVYSSTPSEVVLVGSSIAARINPKYVGTHVSNLAMAGISSQTGLDIVQQVAKKPPLVMIEINDTIQRELDQEFIEHLYHPLFHRLRSYLTIFRQEYQPVSVFIDLLKSRKNQGRTDEEIDSQEMITPELREKIIARHIAAQSQPLDEQSRAKITEQAGLIQAQIEQIEQEGVKVLLFDLPGEPRVKNTQQQQQIETLVKELFPPERFAWMPAPSQKDWVTTDGIHLVNSDAKEYASFIQQQLAKLNLSNIN